MLDGNATVFETIDNIATGDMRTQVRNLLGAFLFSGDDIYKRVKVLSGGEKSRLAIAKLLLQPSNLLIMDEPTNHFDMLAKDVLKNALKKYSGTIIIVSHDRDFLHGLTNKTIEFKDRKIKEHLGDIEEFLKKQKLSSLNQLEQDVKSRQVSRQSKQPGQAKLLREKQKEYQRAESQIKRAVRLSEEKIESFEIEIKRLEELFQEPDFFTDPDKSKKKKIEYASLRSGLEKEMENWTSHTEELDKLQQD
jgi:ATP-binding cassette subfamily F protein 3